MQIAFREQTRFTNAGLRHFVSFFERCQCTSQLLLLLFLTLLLAAVTSTYCRCSYIGGLCCNGWRCLELTAERLAEQQAEGSSVRPHRLKLAGNT